MSVERDFLPSVPTTQRYCILSSPRSGSTLLSRMLYETGLAGDPQEYFNPPLVEIERERLGLKQLVLGEYLRSIEGRRTSPNGVFGIKVHHSQLAMTLNIEPKKQRRLTFLKEFDNLIWIRRRDRVAQAVSQAIALQTKVWSTEDPCAVTAVDVNVTLDHCLVALTQILADERGWAGLVKVGELDVNEVWYEDLVGDYEGTSRCVLAWLGIDEMVAKVPPPPIGRQWTDLNSRLRDELLDYLGAESPPPQPNDRSARGKSLLIGEGA